MLSTSRCLPHGRSRLGRNTFSRAATTEKRGLPACAVWFLEQRIIAELTIVVSARRDMARVEVIQLDSMAAVFTFGLTILCATFAGLISSISVPCNKVLSSLQEASRANSTGSGRSRLAAAFRGL